MAQATQTQVARQSAAGRVWASKAFQDRLLTVTCTILCIIGVIIILFPLGWMISTSLKTRAEAVRFPPTWFRPIRSGRTTAMR